MKTECRSCRVVRLTWTERRRQFARCLSFGMTYKQAAELSPICGKCVTQYQREKRQWLMSPSS